MTRWTIFIFDRKPVRDAFKVYFKDLIFWKGLMVPDIEYRLLKV